VDESRANVVTDPTLVGSQPSAVASSRGLRPGLVISNRYRVGALLGAGGMGLVYEAEHLLLQTTVAVKVLRPELLDALDRVELLSKEAQNLAKVQSEHVVRVLDAGRLETGLPFLAMERLRGLDLRELLNRCGHLPARLTASYALQACAGLAAVHAAGLLHRDIKPSNLFLASDSSGSSRLKLLDLGIARASGRQSDPASVHAERLGSPAYASPEQLETPEDVDMRTDIWSLGVVMVELSTGRVPRLDELRNGRQLAIRLLREKLDPRMIPIVRGCLAERRADRFSSVAELAEALTPLSLGHRHEVAASTGRRSAARGSDTYWRVRLPAVSPRGQRLVPRGRRCEATVEEAAGLQLAAPSPLRG
jgi:eukaryotic-like serine/threonine-protein kinase